MKFFLFIIQFDSFAKTLIPVINQLLKNNHRCDVILLKQKFYKKPWLSNDILLLFEILTLIQTKKIKKTIPIFFVSTLEEIL